MSIVTPLPPIQGRNEKIKPHLTVYSTKTNLTPGLARFYCARGRGEKPEREWRKRSKHGQVRENNSRGMSFCLSDPVYEIWPSAPQPMDQDTGRMENEKTSSHFLTSPVCSLPTPVRLPDWTGADNISSHGVLILQFLFLGVHRGCVLEGTSKGHAVNPAAFRQQWLTGEDHTCYSEIFRYPCWSSVSRLNHSISKYFLLRS